MKVINLGKQEESVPKDIDFDLLVYKYAYESYEGSGFAAWTKGDKYFYHEMGHCSCNGLWDNVESSAKVGISLEDLKKVADKSYGSDAKEVVAYFENPVRVETE